MTITAYTTPASGYWPLGQITVATAGTPVPLNTGIGVQTATTTSRPTRAGRQIIGFTPANTGFVYLLRKPAGQTVSAATTPNFIVMMIPPSAKVDLPTLLGAQFNPDDYVVDADTSGSKAVFVLVYG